MSKPRTSAAREGDQHRAPANPPSALPLAEDLARREKTPFAMTSVGRASKRALGWECGQKIYFNADDPS